MECSPLPLENRVPSPSGDCVATIHEGTIQAEQALRLLSFRVRSFRVMGNRASYKYNLFMGVYRSGWLIKGFRPRSSDPDRLFRHGVAANSGQL